MDTALWGAPCDICGAALYEDHAFRRDMASLSVKRTRMRCWNDHGFIIDNGPAPAPPREDTPQKLCLKCAEPLDTDKPNQTRYHKECYHILLRGKKRAARAKRGRPFKSGFLSPRAARLLGETA